MTNNTPLQPELLQPNNIRSTAGRWSALGASPIPVRLDGSKAPATEWKPFQNRLASGDELDDWFPSCGGLGLVTGVGGVELLEFETERVWVQWCRLMVEAGHADDLRKICDGYLARSGGGGYHLIYRTTAGEPNRKLAQTAKGEPEPRYVGADGSLKTSRVLIETRGVGGYVIVAGGDPAVHPTGRPYLRIRLPEYLVRPTMRLWTFNPDRGVVPIRASDEHQSPRAGTARGWLSPAPTHLCDVSDELREDMFACAFRLNRRTPDRKDGKPSGVLSSTQGQGVPGARPGDAWAAVTTWNEILEPHGWQADHREGEATHWTRPGKSAGTSATTNFGGSGLMYVFTTSTEFDSDETYTKFGAYAVLNFDGDHEQAARDLASRGFADPLQAEADTRQHRLAQLAVEREMQMDAAEMAKRARATRDMRIPPTRTMTDALAAPLPIPEQLVEGLVVGEGVTLLSAQNKTGKSTVGINLVRAVLHGEDLFGKFPTHLPADAGVGVWNAEVSASTYEMWMVEHGIDSEHAHRLTFLHLSGYAIDLQLPVWRERTIAWLRQHNVKLWVLDPLSKIFRGDENSATEVNAFWMAMRQIMAEADVPAAFVIHHAGHTDDDSRARARGSSAIEGDPEVVLSYRHGGKSGNFAPDTKRYLAGVGRIDNIPDVTLRYDTTTRWLSVDEHSNGLQADRQLQDDVRIAQAAWSLLDADDVETDTTGPWISKQKLKDADTGIGDRKTLEALKRCQARGYLIIEDGGNGHTAKIRRGPNRTLSPSISASGSTA